MKKILLLILIFTAFVNWASATEMTIKIINNTPYTFGRKAVATNPDPGYCNDISNNNTPQHGAIDIWDHINPGKEAIFKLTNTRPLCGLEGFVEWAAYENNKIYVVRIDYDIPLIGGNEFLYGCSYPFIMKHLGGGEGSIVDLVFEITGGPPYTPAQETPPPPPVALPSSGNKTLSGEFSWNPRETGLPMSGNDRMQQRNMLLNAFKIAVTAPSVLNRTADGSGTDEFNGSKGFFSNYALLKNVQIKFWDARDDQTNPQINPDPVRANRVIRFSITGLPDGIPIIVSANIKNPQWSVGEETPAKQSSLVDGRWMTFVHEKQKTATTIKYEVYGAWFGNGGGYSSDQNTAFLLKSLLNKSTPNIKGGPLFAKASLLKRAPASERPTQKLIARPNLTKPIQKNQ